MQDVKKYTPKFLNTDKSPKFLNATESFYLLNNRISSRVDSEECIPFLANYLAAEIEKPNGDNFCVGTYNLPLAKKIKHNGSIEYKRNTAKILQHISELYQGR